MFVDILCTFLVRKLLLENLSENRLLLPLAKKCCFFRIFMRPNKVYDAFKTCFMASWKTLDSFSYLGHVLGSKTRRSMKGQRLVIFPF